MELYMSLPSVMIADAAGSDVVEKNTELYRFYYYMYSAVFEVYSQEKREENSCGLPSLGSLQSRKDFIAPMLVEQLSKSGCNPESISYLFDCQSTAVVEGPAATYSLAKAAGLFHTKAVLFSGQGGTEFAQCIEFLLRDVSLRHALCVSSQIVSEPDTRQDGIRYPLGDAAAVTLVSREAVPAFSDLKIISIELDNLKNKPSAIAALIQNKIDLSNERIKWIIVQNESEETVDLREPGSMNRLRYRRQDFQEVNFGCADVFVTLKALICDKERFHRGDRGILFFLGRFGAAAVMEVELMN